MRNFLIVAIFLACAANTFADDPERGRLPDGRAYRTDNQGNQLVDYIAELELNLDSLKRRVNGLEDEVSAKQRMLDRLNSGKPAESALEERDIVRSAPRPKLSDDAKDEDGFAQKRTISEAAQVSSETRAYQEQISGLKNTIENLEQVLKARDNELLALKSRSAVGQQPTARQMAGLDQSQELAALKGQVQDLELALRAKNDALAKADSDLKDLSLEFANYKKEQLAKADTTVGQEPLKLALAKPEEPQAKESEEEMAPVLEDRSERASFSPARSRAVDSVRGTLMTELNKVGALIGTRDRLLEQYNSQRRALVIKPSAARSSRGYNIPQIRGQLASAGSVYALSYLREDINQVKGKVQDDINLLQRMLR